jgi:hypothetical protein
MQDDKLNSVYIDRTNSINLNKANTIEHPNIIDNSKESQENSAQINQKMFSNNLNNTNDNGKRKTATSTKIEHGRRTAINIKTVKNVHTNMPNVSTGDNTGLMETKSPFVKRSRTMFDTIAEENDGEDNEEKRNKMTYKMKKKLKTFLIQYLDSYVETIVMTIITLFALFANDIKTINIDPKYDDLFNIFYLIALFIFFIELIANVWIKSGYVNTFFFYLELLALLSMVMEIDWVLQPFMDALVE